VGVAVVRGTGSPSQRRSQRPYRRNVDTRAEIRDFLTSRRARLTPEQAGLTLYGDKRRVPGLRRSEVAALAGVSIEYYTQLERGSLGGASEQVLDALAGALQLDEAERTHLFDLARAASSPSRGRSRGRASNLRPSIQRLLETQASPAYIRNARMDILAANSLCAALYGEMLAPQALPLSWSNGAPCRADAGRTRGGRVSHLLGLAQCAEVGCKVIGRGEGVGMVAQHPAAPGQDVLVEGAGLLIVVQLAQIGGEPAGRGERFGVVLAQHTAEAGEGVGLKLSGLLVLAQCPEGEAEAARYA
jgi:transcriptional regulator with XRE-family HTH domain